MTQPFRITRRVEFGDTDMAGIAHFANFFRYMEVAETDFLLARGLTGAGASRLPPHRPVSFCLRTIASASL